MPRGRLAQYLNDTPSDYNDKKQGDDNMDKKKTAIPMIVALAMSLLTAIDVTEAPGAAADDIPAVAARKPFWDHDRRTLLA